MKTIQMTVMVDDDRRATIQLPEGIGPGEHLAVLVVDERPIARPVPASLEDFPVIDVGPWPEGLSLSREDLYGDDGR